MPTLLKIEYACLMILLPSDKMLRNILAFIRLCQLSCTICIFNISQSILIKKRNHSYIFRNVFDLLHCIVMKRKKKTHQSTRRDHYTIKQILMI